MKLRNNVNHNLQLSLSIQAGELLVNKALNCMSSSNVTIIKLSLQKGKMHVFASFPKIVISSLGY